MWTTILLSGSVLLAAPSERMAEGRAMDPRCCKLDRAMPASWYAPDTDPEKLEHTAILGDGDWIEQAVTNGGGRVIVRTPSVVTAMAPHRTLLAMIADARVLRVTLGRLPASAPKDDPSAPNPQPPRAEIFSPIPLGERPYAVENMGLDRFRAADRLTGAGVVLACIESFSLPDFRHPDLRHPDGATRFDALWDQRFGPTAPAAGAPYGTLYDKAAIDDLLTSGKARDMRFGEAAEHITESVAAAAGNGAVLGKYCGVAPEATLIAVTDTIDGPGVIEGADFAFRRAQALGMPCVISISESLNHLMGFPEDGRDPVGVALSEMTASAPGRAIVASAGNNGHIARHVRLVLTGYGPVQTAQYWLQPTSLMSMSKQALHSVCFANDQVSDMQMRIRYARPVAAADQPEDSNPRKELQFIVSTPWIALAQATAEGPLEFDLTLADEVLIF